MSQLRIHNMNRLLIKTLFNMPFLHASYNEAVTYLIELSFSGGQHLICTPNVHGFYLFHRYPGMKNVYAQSSGAFLDGMPLVWAARFIHNTHVERIAGADLFIDVFREIVRLGGRVFILGGMPGVAEKAIRNLGYFELIGTQISFYSPPLGFEKNPQENNKIVNIINAYKPHIIFAALGTPKQEFWLSEHKIKIDFGVAIAIGASVDFVAGTQKRAPKWMRESGIEWLYRLIRDPKKMWKRYLITNFFFAICIPYFLAKTAAKLLNKNNSEI